MSATTESTPAIIATSTAASFRRAGLLALYLMIGCRA